MTKSQDLDQLELLRVDIEAAYSIPLLLVVSAARDTDGKAIVATELALSMQAAGYSTLLVRADLASESSASAATLEEKSADVVAKRILRDASSGLAAITLPGEHAQRTASREAVLHFTTACREAYSVTIVDAAVMLSSAFAMSAALAADGVVLAARSGRRVVSADREFAKKLAHEGLSFLGVVTIDAALINAAPPQSLLVESARSKISSAAGLRESPSA